jgi:transketolase
LCFTRQDLPIFERTGVSVAEGVARGAYVLRDAKEPRLALIATGSEVQLAVGAWEKLATEGIGARVVSMPSMELFRKQDASYRDAVLPPSLEKRLSIEAGVTYGWREWVGTKGDTLGLDRFGASAPLKDVMQGLGFTVENVMNRARKLLAE